MKEPPGRPNSAGDSPGSPQQGGGFYPAGQRPARYSSTLTDHERDVLSPILNIVLRDMKASGAILPAIEDQTHEDLDEDFVGALVRSPDGVSAVGIRIQASSPEAEQLVDLAAQLQEWEVEELSAAGRPAAWPECPEHPNSHPLSPELRDGAGVWCCPRTGEVVSAIGTLATSR